MKYRDKCQRAGDRFTSGPVVMMEWLYQQGWPITYASPNCNKIFGYSINEITGGSNKLQDCIHPEDLDRVKNKVEEEMKNKAEHFEQDYRILTPYGKVICVFDYRVLLYDDRGEVVSSAGYLIDQTNDRQNQSKLNAIMSALPDMIFELDDKGQIKDYRIPNNELLEVKPHELLGQDVLRVLPTEAAKVFDSAIERANLKGISAGGQYQIDTPSGPIYFELTVVPITKKSGQKSGFIAISHNVTEYKWMEEYLLSSEEKFRVISEAAFDAIIMINQRGEVEYWNLAAERVFGYTGAEMMGKDVHNFIMPEQYREDYTKGYNRFKNSGEGHAIGKVLELTAKNKAGLVFPIEIAISSIRMDEGYWAVATIRDITERKAMEEELRKLSVAIEQSPISVLITDLDGNIEYANPYFTEMTGFLPAEVQGKNWRVLESGRMSAERHKNLLQTIKSGEVWGGEFQNKKKNGEPYWERVLVSPVKNDSGDTTRLIVLKGDITELKQTEKSLITAKKVAEEANKAKSEFLANMSHEIRTPMNAIIGFTQLALRTELSSKQFNFIKKTQTSAQLLLKIINEILDFSKIEAGKLDIEIVPFNLDWVLDNLISQLGVKAEEKGLELLLKAQPDVPSKLLGDPLRLGQVLLNLASNAVKFTDKGQVVIEVKCISNREKEVGIQFIVKDTGIGMTQEQITKLFQAFSQAEMSTTRKYGGTGLGLTISKRLTNLMGGQIWVESKVGKGSAFYVEIYFKTNTENQSHTHSLDLNSIRVPVVDDNSDSQVKGIFNTNGPRILLVEDNEINQEVAREILQGAGLVVDVAADGIEGVAAIKAKKYDAVLMDVQMPHMDGYEATQVIRQDSNYSSLPIIAMTANAMVGNREKCLQAGMNDYITKPIDTEQLFKKLAYWFGKNKEDQNVFFNPMVATTKAADEELSERDEKKLQITGIDQKAGLSRLGGNKELFQMMLLKFKDNQQYIIKEIQEALDQEDWPTAKRLVHTLKGISGNIGAQGLYEITMLLEDDMEEQNITQIKILLKDLEGLLKEIFASIAQLEDKETKKETSLSKPKSLDMSTLRPLLEDLKRLLRDFDMDAIKILQLIITHTTGSELAEKVLELKSYLDKYDFEKSLEVVNDIMETMEADGRQ